jgi:hypothetical protein
MMFAVNKEKSSLAEILLEDFVVSGCWLESEAAFLILF